MTDWHKVTDDVNMPMVPHGQDSCTARMLLSVKKDYYPHVYFGYYDYETMGFYYEDDGLWSVEGLRAEVTHWALEPEAPEEDDPNDLNKAIVMNAPWNHRTSAP